MRDLGGSFVVLCYEVGWMAWYILLLAILGLWVAISRAIVLGRIRLAAGSSLRRLDEILGGSRLQDLSDVGRSPIGRVLAEVVPYLDGSPAQVAAALALHGRREARKLHRGFNLLGMIVVTAPLCGSLGTLTGITGIWYGYYSGPTVQAAVSANLAESLLATAAGLAVSICAYLARIGLRTWAERSEAEIEEAGGRLLGHVVKGRGSLP